MEKVACDECKYLNGRYCEFWAREAYLIGPCKYGVKRKEKTMDKIEYLQEELNKAIEEKAEEEYRDGIKKAAGQVKAWIDACTEIGIPEDKAWKLLLTSMKEK